MREQVATAKAVAALISKLRNPEIIALTLSQNWKEIKMFLRELMAKGQEGVYFFPLDDSEVPLQYQGYIPKYRKLSVELGYAGIIAWRVRAGFALKTHAFNAGPCYDDLSNLDNYELQNDEPTKSSFVFWIPRVISQSTGKSVRDQLALLSDLRKKFELPEQHLQNFGSAAILSGLILAHLKRTGERIPFNCAWVRSDTLLKLEDDKRLCLGFFDNRNLFCCYTVDDDCKVEDTGCFALGIEELKEAV